MRTGILSLAAAVAFSGSAPTATSAPAAPASPPPPQQQAMPHDVQPGTDFAVRLNIDNGHIGEVYIGCRPGATDGYDAKMDDMAPPPGIGVGYTFLVPPDRKANLYRDMRAPADVSQWLFFAKVDAGPVTVSWDPKELPAGLDFFVGRWDGKSADTTETVDARKVHSLKVSETGYLRIWTASRPAQPAKTGAAGD